MLTAALALDALDPFNVKRVLERVSRVRDDVFACQDACAHKGGPLSEGRLSGVRLACPWHGWMYDVRTGECVLPGRGHRVASYAARVEAGEVWVEVP